MIRDSKNLVLIRYFQMTVDLYILAAGSALTGLIFYFLAGMIHVLYDMQIISFLGDSRSSMVIMAFVYCSTLYTCFLRFLIIEYRQTFCKRFFPT